MAHFIEDIFRTHGFPQIIISDGDLKFTSNCRKSLFKTLETQLRFSTTFRPEADGQTERLNHTLEIMLRHYVDEPPTTWTKYLPIINFAYNSAQHSATERSPFSLVYAKDPDSPLTLTSGKNNTTVEASAALIISLHAVWTDTRDCLAFAQSQQAKFINEHRRPREFASADLVNLKQSPMRKNPKQA